MTTPDRQVRQDKSTPTTDRTPSTLPIPPVVPATVVSPTPTVSIVPSAPTPPNTTTATPVVPSPVVATAVSVGPPTPTTSGLSDGRVLINPTAGPDVVTTREVLMRRRLSVRPALLKKHHKTVSKGPMRAGRVRNSRGSGFTHRELDSLLDLCEETLPLYNDEWDDVARRHELRYPGTSRGANSLKRKFASLYRKKVPADDPRMPTEVRRAKDIRLKMTARSDDGEGEPFDGGDDMLNQGPQVDQRAAGDDDDGDDDDDDDDDDDRESETDGEVGEDADMVMQQNGKACASGGHDQLASSRSNGDSYVKGVSTAMATAAAVTTTAAAVVGGPRSDTRTKPSGEGEDLTTLIKMGILQEQRARAEDLQRRQEEREEERARRHEERDEERRRREEERKEERERREAADKRHEQMMQMMLMMVNQMAQQQQQQSGPRGANGT